MSHAPLDSPASALPPSGPRAVLADDERLMREQLRARLAEAWPQLQIVAEARNGEEAVQLVAQHRPDVVFLDIRMPGLNGVEAARQIAQLPPPEGADEDSDAALVPELVFITAYDQYAVQAFEQGAVDYVLKPAERERLQLTAQRVSQRLAARALGAQGGVSVAAAADGATAASAQGNHANGAPVPLQHLLHQLSSGLSGQAPQYLKWIQAQVGQNIQMIAADDVLFFISDEKYTRVQTAQVEALIRKPIKELVDELDPQRFWQIHRSTLVNVNAVAGVSRDLRGRQIVSVRGHNERLEVSRSYTGLFKGM
jgi:DNA-binding LytR/AlgR family response regulator